MSWLLIGLSILAVAFVAYVLIGRAIISFYGDVGLPLIPLGGPYTTIADAVAHKDTPEVRRLIKAGANVNAQDERGVSPLVIATETDQYEIAELLIKSGADVWAADSLGFTVGAFMRNELPSVELESSRQRVIELLKSRGYPWPPYSTEKVKEMLEAGNWPPR